MKIKEAAKRVGVNGNVLRFYEDKGLLHPARDDNGYRHYREDDLHTLQLILTYRNMGFSLSHIQKLFETCDEENRTEMFLRQQSFVSRQIKKLQIMQEGITECLDHVFMKDEDALLSVLQNITGEFDREDTWKDRWDFDSWALQYDDVVHRGTGDRLKFYEHYDKVLDRCADIVNERSGNVLEIGIGTGNLAARIALHQTVTGIDQSMQMLLMTRRKYPDIPLRIGTFLDIPFADESFDTIVTSYAFHHIREVEKMSALKEMDRVVCKGGRIILCDLMFADENARLAFSSICSPREKEDLEDEYFANVDNLCDLLHKMNYTCSCEQVDDLIWILCAHKIENL